MNRTIEVRVNGQPRQIKAGEASQPPWPDALEFLRWHLSAEPRLALGGGPRRWVWERAH